VDLDVKTKGSQN